MEMVNQKSVGSNRPITSYLKAAFTSPRGRIIALVLAAISILIGIYRFYAWWVSPEHRLSQFVAAWQAKDMKTMLSLADSDEVQRLQLTPEKWRTMLAEAAGDSNGVVLGNVDERPLNDQQSGYNRIAVVELLDHNGKILIGKNGMPTKPAIYAYNTDNGWKIALSALLRSIVARRKWATGISYAQLCMQHNSIAEVFDPTDETWHPGPQ